MNDATGRWFLWLLGCVLIIMALTLSACNDGDDTTGPDGNGPPTPTLLPGDTFELGTTETLTLIGNYLLPAGATTITTRCTGEVTIEIPTVPPQTNTCNSLTGSSSMTNPVTGASEVTYTFGEGAFATVTVDCDVM